MGRGAFFADSANDSPAKSEAKASLAASILVISLFFSSAITLSLPSGHAAPDLVDHALILIDGDAEFTFANGVLMGNGTRYNPYIISGWKIDGNLTNIASTAGIEIVNTKAHVVIQDVLIWGTADDTSGGQKGIVVKAENVTVRDLTIRDMSSWGVNVEDARNVLVKNVTILGGGSVGMLVGKSQNVSFLFNHVEGLVGHSGQSPTGIGFLARNPSSDVTVAGNEFVDNIVQAYVYDEGPAIDITWTLTGGGNYWSDYTGVDADFDGIGDTPYPIPESESDPAPIFKDVEPPTTEISVTGTSGESPWFITAVTVGFNATDNTAVFQTWYRVDGGSWVIYTGPFTFGDLGTHSIDYYSEDNYGNLEAQQTRSTAIDTDLPSVSGIISGTPGAEDWFVSEPTIALDGSDATSGLSQILYRVDGSSWMSYAAPFTVPEGQHSVEYYAIDNAGQESLRASISLSVDATDPIISITQPKSSDLIEGPEVTVIGFATDEISGVSRVEIRVNNGTWLDVNETSLWSYTLVLANGTHFVEARATDAAGNLAEVDILITVETPAPSDDGDAPSDNGGDTADPNAGDLLSPIPGGIVTVVAVGAGVAIVIVAVALTRRRRG